MWSTIQLVSYNTLLSAIAKKLAKIIQIVGLPRGVQLHLELGILFHR